MLPIAEIVHVIDGTRLIDAESYERSLDTEGRSPLAPGYYVVVWDEGIATPRYDHDATFLGPLRSREETHTLIARHYGCRPRLTAYSRRTGRPFHRFSLAAAPSRPSHPLNSAR